MYQSNPSCVYAWMTLSRQVLVSHGAVSLLHHIYILDLLGVGIKDALDANSKRANAKRCPIFDVLAAANTY